MTAANRKRLAILVATLLPLVIRAALLPLFPAPQPRVHDEFSYLLAADTFLHGRLVNPQHPFWVHFESMHILTRPVYVSVFPLAPAAALALGRLLFGHPWAGVWLSSGLMCGAVCWMLLGWVPLRWAFLGALLVILRIGVSSYWMNSYWGGSVAAIGGALVLGALPGIVRRPGWPHGLLMGVGLAILANSRPLEGAIFGLAIAVTSFRALRRVIIPIGLPIVLVLAITGIGMAYYFTRVTGKPWVVPYVFYRTTMTVAPHFVWQQPRPAPLFNNAEIRNFYLYDEVQMYRTARDRPLSNLLEKAAVYWRFYFGPFLTIPLLALPFAWRDRRVRQMLLMGAIFSLALVGQVWHNAHYAAPATGLAILIVIMCMRRMALFRWRKRPVGQYAVRLVPVACALMLVIQVLGTSTRPGVKRAAILHQLERTREQHLVFVRYDTIRHDTGDEWVYNDADIDGSPVVWARELDRGSNAKLMQNFSGRRVWLVEPDVREPKLVVYSEAPYRPMPFVQLGAPGIEVLRSPEDVKRRVLEQGQGETRFTCDGWNALFTEATGVAGPNADPACWGANRSQPVSFEDWFRWIKGQR